MSGSEAQVSRKRGRPPKPAGEAKRYSIGITTTLALRDRVRAAAEISGRSMTAEIEFRIEQALALEEPGGSAETADFRAQVRALLNAVDAKFGASSWSREIHAFLAARAGILELIDSYMPDDPDFVKHHVAARSGDQDGRETITELDDAAMLLGRRLARAIRPAARRHRGLKASDPNT